MLKVYVEQFSLKILLQVELRLVVHTVQRSIFLRNMLNWGLGEL